MRHGIRVNGFSSDGDPRLMAAMRRRMCLDDEVCYMQDGVHGGLRFRTCFLRSYAALPMGKKLASVAHLKSLIRDTPKSIHGLVFTDVSPIDRQNFKSLQKSMSIRTRDALSKFVPDSEGTVFFLQLCDELTSSLMDYDITPYERIETIFHAIFFLRIWRKWILKSKYVLKENFITSNSYICTELNGSNLLKLIRIFRDRKKPELFLTTLFDSQACERAFRQLRSMSSPNFTKINFHLLELLHMVKRLEVQNEILYSKLSSSDIKLPKLEKKRKTTAIYALPTEEEIEECLNRAKRSALNDALHFEMEIDSDEIDVCEVPIPNRLETDEELNENYDCEDDIENEIGHEHLEDTYEAEDDGGILQEEEDDQQRAFITITEHSGRKKLLRKSTLVWILSEGTRKISSDRLIRVQDKKNAVDPSISIDPSKSDIVYESKYIKIGDWCFFKAGEEVYIGLLHAFRYANRRLVKDKSYKFESVNLVDKPNLSKELEVLSTWYLVNHEAVLVPASVENHQFISMENYVATISISPTIDRDTRSLFFSVDDFKAIDAAVLKLIGQQNC